MRIILLLLIPFLFFSGCAPTTAVKKHDPVFFPTAPIPPRVQFLTGIGDSRDVEGDGAEVSLFSMTAVQHDALRAFSKPYGITAHGSKFYVSDTLAGSVAVIDLRQKNFTWLKGNFGPGKLIKPINLTTDKTGNLYVADTGRKQVVAYDAEGNFLQTYSSAYELKPVDVAVDDQRVYILDMSQHKVLVFNKTNGKLLEGLGQDSENPQERLYLATNMTLTEQGLLYVANAGTGSIIKLDRDGHVLGSFGKMGDGLGQFGRPRGVATDSKKRFYVVDASHQNVQLFNDKDQLLMFFGNPGLPLGSLNLPAGIAVTDQDLDYYQQFAAPGFELEQVILVVNQVGRYKINIYGLGKMQGIDYEAYYREGVERRRKAEAEQVDKKK
jgi:DNA-binding beta-propeller fold protein YncE